MTPELLYFGISSLIRIGQAGKTAAEQAARDAPVLFPQLQGTFDPLLFVNGYFSVGDARQMVSAGAQLAHLWDASLNQARNVSAGVDTLLLAAVERETRLGNANADPRVTRNDLAAGRMLVKQWDPAKAPVSPWIAVMLTAADIALEYVASNPHAVDVGGEGSRKIIAAYAAELSELLPDDGDFGAREGFAGRLGATFLRAGLGIVAENPDFLSSQAHVQSLLRNSLTPLVAAFPSSPAQQLVWNELVDTVMGPVAAAAFDTVATHQAEFLGDDFSVDETLGALTQAVFLELADDGLTTTFKRDGLLELYRSVLGVAVAQPSLFIDGNKPRQEIAREALSSLAGVLSSAESFDGNLARELAGTAVSVIGTNASRLIGTSEPWHKVAADVTTSLSASIGQRIVSSPNNVLTKQQAVEVGRIVLSAIGDSPAILVDDQWQGVIGSIATAMAADPSLLLSGDDWTQIAAVAAAEAATNPQRLFAFAGNQSVLAGRLLSTVLAAASEALADPEQAKRTVLRGATLREALLIALRLGGGNVKAIRDHLDDIGALVTMLNTFVTSHHEEYGSRESLRMFRALLAALLDGAGLPPLIDSDVAEELLKGGV